MPSQLIPVITKSTEPKDPPVLGLTNLPTSDWDVVSNGSRQIAPGTIKLAPVAKIDFDSADSEVG